MHWILYAAKDEAEAERVAELLDEIARGQVDLETLDILISKSQIAAPHKHPSEWTASEWEAYYASLPTNARILTDEEFAEEQAQETRGEYLDLDTFLALKPEENDAR